MIKFCYRHLIETFYIVNLQLPEGRTHLSELAVIHKALSAVEVNHKETFLNITESLNSLQENLQPPLNIQLNRTDISTKNLFSNGYHPTWSNLLCMPWWMEQHPKYKRLF